MKAKSRFLGIDDAPFRFSDESVPVVGVVVQAPSYIEGVLTTLAEVDGHDATDRIASMVRGSRYRAGLAMVFIDGTAVGGFNMIDVDVLREAVGRPIITVTRRKPDLVAIETALRRRFDDWDERLALIRRHPVEAIRTRAGTVWVTYVGGKRADVQEALSLTTIRGVLPEPLRVAHLIAAGIVRGESRGRA
ncbi:MAG: DUF99 family protein [Methanobacteriota archaeon]|nr:MAG: DUF99 family protein [Euryarchaeota archaeon]